MLKTRFRIFGFTLLFSSAAFVLEGAWSSQNGKLMRAETVAVLPAAEHYRLGAIAFNEGKWQEAIRQFNIVYYSFPGTTYAQEALFYLGVSNFHRGEYDVANTAFNRYLREHSNPKNFQEAIEYKFEIAERFKSGAKKHVLDAKQLPKWASADPLAIEIYDEVASALPSSDLAAKALFSKGTVLARQRDYRGSIDSFQLLIQRFPKHELAPESFLAINRVYLHQLRREFQNPDILAFAEINLQRFEESFPQEERIEQAYSELMAIKEAYAKGLYETASFYQRIRKNDAAVIYYQKILLDFPETTYADWSKRRLSSLRPSALELPAPIQAAGEDFEISDDIDFSELIEEDQDPA